MGGWFRKEIKTVEDMKGLKFRIAGIAGMVLRQAGRRCRSRSPAATSIRRWRRARSTPPNGSVRTTTRSSASTRSRRTTTIPAGGKAGRRPRPYVNLTKWNELPKDYKAVIQAAAAWAQTLMLAKYDAENPKALRELVAAGTKLMPFPQSVMEAAFSASNELYAEISAKNPKFKKIYENWRPFRNEEILWFRVVREHLRQLHGAPVGRQQTRCQVEGG